MTKRFVPDSRFEGRPRMPLERPPTRAEVWEYVNHWYADLKTEQQLLDFARACFVGNYVRWVNSHGWRNPPDWKEGDPTPPGACPTGPIFPERQQKDVYELYERFKAARQQAAPSPQLSLEGAAA